MQNLNNDIEDIFRRAADEYPLKDGEDRWDEISRRLENIPAEKKGKYAVWKKGIVVLLLSGAFLAVNDGSIKDPLAIIMASETKPNVPASGTLGYQKNFIEKGNKASFSSKYVTADLSPVNTLSRYLPGQQVNKTSFSTIQSEVSHNDNSNPVNGIHRLPLIEGVVDNPQTIVESEKSVPVSKANETEVIKQPISVKSQKNKETYYGVAGAIQISAVKAGGLNKPALQAGIIVGYKLNQRLSLESGIILSKRNYQSSGENFNMKNMQSSMPTGMKIISLTGQSKLLEIPVQASWHFEIGSHKSVYIKSGVSSYFINSENNQYKTMLNGIEGSMVGSYKENKFYPAAALNIAVGFQKKISTSIGLKVEPFIQLPLKGMGVGELPFKNAGLRLVLFHQN